MALFMTDKLLDRLRRGSGPPLRKGQLSRITGYSKPMLDKLIEAGTLRTVCPPGAVEQRIPVREAARFAREIGALD